MQVYVVQSGDSVDGIAAAFQVSVSEIVYVNQLSYPYPLAVGQALLIPEEGEQEEALPQIIVGGYAYPFINDKILQTTLPYLSELYIFSYGFTTEGELIPPAVSDEPLIQGALQMGTAPILTLTPLDSEGRFNNQLITALVNDSRSKERLTTELLELLPRKGYRGVDVDFEYIKAEDRDAFTAFVAELTGIMNVNGYQVSVALAPKTSDDQQGLLYQGKDYGGLGAAANYTLLMTYEWGYSRSEPMAVAPINKVRQVVDYAVTRIPREKLRLGIPNYGYDWTLPYVKGETVAQSIGNQEAIGIAIAHGAVIQFDELAQTPYFRYEENGREHEVWFEDVRSMQAKFSLLREYNLGGANYWQIMRLFLPNWILLEDNFTIRKTAG